MSRLPLILLVIAMSISIASSQIKSDGSGFASLTDNYSDRAIDMDGNGKLDYLNVDVGVHVAHPGEYSLTGYLYDQDDREVAWSADHKNLTVGNHTMQLAFDGKAIAKSGLAGPYRLGNLSLNWGSATLGLIPCAYTDNAHQTASYSLDDFVDLNGSDKILSGSGNGQILLTLSISTIVPVVSGSYMYDIEALNIPPISTPFDIISLDPKKFAKGGYSYGFEGLYIPGKPNNFTVIARGVENLNIGLMKLQGDLHRTWISSQFLANDSAIAKAETDLISPRGSYHVRIFGDAADNASQVDLIMKVEKKLIVDGAFSLGINTTGFPEGSYSIKAQALNGSFCFDDLEFGDREI